MTTASEQPVEAIYSGGFIGGLLTARFYALRYSLNEGAFLKAAPNELPTIVQLILERLPRSIVDEAIFCSSWRALDHLLTCDTPEELEVAFANTPGLLVH